MNRKDDPAEIASWLIDEHGADGAARAALDGTILAQDVGDNYALSVWREVRFVLAQRTDDTPCARRDVGCYRFTRQRVLRDCHAWLDHAHFRFKDNVEKICNAFQRNAS